MQPAPLFADDIPSPSPPRGGHGISKACEQRVFSRSSRCSPSLDNDLFVTRKHVQHPFNPAHQNLKTAIIYSHYHLSQSIQTLLLRCAKLLKKHSDVRLHGMGAAVTHTLALACALQR